MTQQSERQLERHLDERHLGSGATDANSEAAEETQNLSSLTRSPGTTRCLDLVETSTRSGQPVQPRRMRRLQRAKRRFLSHLQPAKEVQARPTTLSVSRALRHSEDIEWCLREAGLEAMLIRGTLSPGTRINRDSFPEYIYIIAANGRIERMEMLADSNYEQSFAELLPDDAEVVLIVPHSTSTREATLYMVQDESPRNFWDEAGIAIR